MSKWTGKCDFYDHCEMIYKADEVAKIAKIYMGNAKVYVKEPRDLIPYYTNLVASMSRSEDEQTIYLTQDSYIDIEERSSLAWRVYHVIKAARKCKKSKTILSLDDIKEQLSFDAQIEVWKEIIEIVNDEPDIIKVHLPKDYRKTLWEIEINLIPKYFSTVHLASSNRQRVEFLKYTEENGFGTPLDNGGEFHPLLWRLQCEVTEYNKMINKYKGE